MHAVYCIENTVDGRRYVGSAVCLNARIYQHRRELANGTHHNKKLLSAWIEHGERAFRVFVLEATTDKSKLLDIESYWISKLDVINPDKGYNVCPFATSRLGLKNSPEHNAKIGNANRGKKHSPEFCAALSARQRGTKRGPKSRKSVEKTAAAQRGQKRAPLSADHKAKISQALAGRRLKPPGPLTTEHRAAIARALTGKKRKPFTVEHRARIAEAARNQPRKNGRYGVAA